MTEFKVMNDDEIRDFCIKKDFKIFQLEKQLQQKENIIKEVREYITNNYRYEDLVEFNDILKILDKENKNEKIYN